eukprot:2830028-Pyramimonas_sp.AAC.1
MGRDLRQVHAHGVACQNEQPYDGNDDDSIQRCCMLPQFLCSGSIVTLSAIPVSAFTTEGCDGFSGLRPGQGDLSGSHVPREDDG